MYLLSFLQCTNYTVVCDQIAKKSFVVLNASILGKYRKKTSLRSASQVRCQNSVTGSINKFWRGSKYTSNPRVWTKKQSFSSQNSTKTGVDPKKVFISKYAWIFTNSGVKPQKNLGLKDSSSHKFWRNIQYLGSLWPRTALQWHRACYFLWGTILTWGALFLFVEAQVGILGGARPRNVPRGVGPALSLQQSTIALSLKRCCSQSFLLKKWELFEVIKSWFLRLVYSNMQSRYW